MQEQQQRDLACLPSHHTPSEGMGTGATVFCVLLLGVGVLLGFIVKEYDELRKVVLQTKLAKKTLVAKVV